MKKPKTISGYDHSVTDACERVLVTLLRSLGPWKKSIFLIGGLTPRYLVKARPPTVPPHAGTADVDIVVDLTILTDTEAYRTLEENLRNIGFQQVANEKGVRQPWRWFIDVDGGRMMLEFLADYPKADAAKVKNLPTDGGVSALNIPHASLVFDLHDTVEITAELLGDEGRATETIRYANIVSFICLKAFAYDDRRERKDAHDILYCLENYEGGVDAVLDHFALSLATAHEPVIRKALGLLAQRFCDRKAPDESYLMDGPVAVARFEEDGADRSDDEATRNRRIVRQRRAADIVSGLVQKLIEPQQI
jgi:hypothetical protein